MKKYLILLITVLTSLHVSAQSDGSCLLYTSQEGAGDYQKESKGQPQLQYPDKHTSHNNMNCNYGYRYQSVQMKLWASTDQAQWNLSTKPLSS